MGNAMDQSGRVKIAVIGLGRMGKRHVHTIFYRVPDAEVVAVCSTEPHEITWGQSNEEYQRFGITTYDSYDKTLAHSGLSAVWISKHRCPRQPDPRRHRKGPPCALREAPEHRPRRPKQDASRHAAYL